MEERVFRYIYFLYINILLKASFVCSKNVLLVWTMYLVFGEEFFKIVSYWKYHILFVTITVIIILGPTLHSHRLTRNRITRPADRRTCKNCYKMISSKFGTRFAQNRSRKVYTYCVDCPNRPYLCLYCFSSIHGKEMYQNNVFINY